MTKSDPKVGAYDMRPIIFSWNLTIAAVLVVVDLPLNMSFGESLGVTHRARSSLTKGRGALPISVLNLSV